VGVLINFISFYSSYSALKPRFLGCKSIGFGMQKMMFYPPKAMLLYAESIAFAF